MKLVVHGLIDKRAETVGKIEAHRDQLAQLMADLDHLDRCIHIFEPDIDLGELPSKPVPPPNAAFRGEVQRFPLHTRRTSETVLTTHELGEAIMRQRGLNVADKALRKQISQRTGHSARKPPQSGLHSLRTGERERAVAVVRHETRRSGRSGGRVAERQFSPLILS